MSSHPLISECQQYHTRVRRLRPQLPRHLSETNGAPRLFSTYLLDLALKVLALNEVGNLVIILTLLILLHGLVAIGELAEGGQGVGAELVQDTGDELSEFLVLAVTGDDEGVGGDGGVDCGIHVSVTDSFSCQLFAASRIRTLGSGEVDDVAVVLEHVDLLNSLDGLSVELLQGGKKLLVVGAGAGGGALDLATGSTLATEEHIIMLATRGSISMFRSDSDEFGGEGRSISYPVIELV